MKRKYFDSSTENSTRECKIRRCSSIDEITISFQKIKLANIKLKNEQKELKNNQIDLLQQKKI